MSSSNSNQLSLPQAIAAGAVASALTFGAAYYLLLKPKLEEQQQERPNYRTAAEKEEKEKTIKTGKTALTISLRATKDANYWPDHSKLTPGQLFDFLLERNRQFVDGHFIVPDLSAKRRRQVADQGQHPPVCIVACADARVPPEYIFGAGVGDLFLIRAAGSSVDRVGMGSLEYGVMNLGIKLILVMGHSQCGAVTAALKQAKDEVGHAHEHPIDREAGPDVPRTNDNSVWSVVEACLIPARETIMDLDPDCSATTHLEEAIARNTKHQANVLWTNSKILRDAVRSKKVAIRCCRSFIRTGQVFEIPHVPRKDKRGVLAPPTPLFTSPSEVVLTDD